MSDKAETLKSKLASDPEMLAKWKADPVAVMIEEGIAEKPEDVVLKGSGTTLAARSPGGRRPEDMEGTLCGCALSVELEYSGDAL